MRKISLLFVLVALFSGCSKKPTAISFLDRVYTVEEFQKDKDTRKKVLNECQNNPGELRQDPNCVNAGRAAVSQQLSNEIPRF